MLRKLMKYEIKATSRIFLPLYGAVVVLAMINRLFAELESMRAGSSIFESLGNTNIMAQRFSEIPTLLAMTAYVFLIIALFVVTTIVIVQRFYKNLLGDEGYLMFTLPVQPWKNITNKLLVSIMWTIITSIVTVASILIMVLDAEVIREFLRGMEEMFRLFNTVMNMNAGVFLTQMAVLMFISLVVGILQIYASVSIGQLFSRHKLLASVGVYVAINIVMQTVSSILTVMMTLLNKSWITDMVDGPA